MTALKLVYFEGCPNSKHVRATLLTAGVEFEVVKQNKLSEDDPLRSYSSPTVLKGDEIIYGTKSSNRNQTCTLERLSEQEMRRRILGNISGKKARSIWASIGSLGSSTIVGLCPICIPAIGAFLSSIGLGILVNEEVLKPLLIIMLGLAVFGLAWSYRKEHGRLTPLITGLIAAISMYIGRYIYIESTINSILMYGGIGGIMLATIWNLRLRKKHGCNACK